MSRLPDERGRTGETWLSRRSALPSSGAIDDTPSLGAGEKLNDDAVPVPRATFELTLDRSETASAGCVRIEGRSTTLSTDGPIDDDTDGRDSPKVVVDGPCANAA